MKAVIANLRSCEVHNSQLLPWKMDEVVLALGNSTLLVQLLHEAILGHLARELKH